MTIAETDRIRLRQWRLDEADRLLDILSRDEVIRWLGEPPPEPLADVVEATERIGRWHRTAAEDAPLGRFAIEVKDTGVVAGTVVLAGLPNAEAGEVEIGWHLHPDSWGHGYASEAARLTAAHGFDHGLEEIWALTNTDNVASQRVCGALGMQYLGEVEGLWYQGRVRLFSLANPTR